MSRLTAKRLGKLNIPLTVSGDAETILRENAAILQAEEDGFATVLTQFGAAIQKLDSTPTRDELHIILASLRTIKENWFANQRARNVNIKFHYEKALLHAHQELTSLDFLSADFDEDSLIKTPWDIYANANKESAPKVGDEQATVTAMPPAPQAPPAPPM